MGLEALPFGTRRLGSGRFGRPETKEQADLAAAIHIRSLPRFLTVVLISFLCLGLEDLWGQQGSVPPPVPSELSAVEALRGNYDNSLVRLGGRVFDLAAEGSLATLAVESGGLAF
jgi:hypothetical protein